MTGQESLPQDDIMELAAAEYNQEMLNEEIQDIDSDQEDIAIAQHY